MYLIEYVKYMKYVSIIIFKNQEFMVYNYVNFNNIFNDKELLLFNYSKLNVLY